MKRNRFFVPLVLALGLFLPLISSASTFTHNLYYGVTTTDVSSLQQFLKDEGLYSGPITATFGNLTQTAVVAFQKQEGIIPSNGVFGPTTRSHAEKIISSHPEWLTTLSNMTTYKNVDNNVVKSPSYSSNGIPAGATAECRDGTYSFSLNHKGSCSHHGGVSNWLQ